MAWNWPYCQVSGTQVPISGFCQGRPSAAQEDGGPDAMGGRMLLRPQEQLQVPNISPDEHSSPKTWLPLSLLILCSCKHI